MAYVKKPAIVSGPGFTGQAQGISAEEAQIAAEEANAPKTPKNQSQADEFFKAKAREGLDESGIPEQVFHGASVDPSDYADGPQKTFIGRSGMRARFGTDMAIGRVSDQMRKDYGIGDDEFVSWTWQDDYAGSDKQLTEEWLQNNPDGRIPTYQGTDRSKKGQPCKMQGLVLTALPMAVWKEIQGELDAEVEQREWALAHGNPDLPSDGNEQARLRDENSRTISQMLQGSPTHGNDLDTALRKFTKEETEAIVEKYRWLNSQKPEGRQGEGAVADARANAIDRVVETAKAQSTGRSTFAVNGFRDKK